MTSTASDPIPDELLARMADRLVALHVPERYRLDLRDPRLVGWVYSEDVDAAMEWAVGFLLGRPTNLYLHGDVGRCKTALAWATVATVLRESELDTFERRWPRHLGAGPSGFTGDLVLSLMDRERDLIGLDPDDYPARDRLYGGPVGQLQRLPLVLLDDLGVERPTDWVQERLNRVFSARHSAGLPTIVTSNLSPGQIERALGSRVASRLAEDTVAIHMAGPDRRRLQGRPLGPKPRTY